MSENALALDPAIAKDLFHRVGRAASMKIIFKNVDATPYPITGIPFEFYAKRHLDDDVKLMNLTIGNGLTIGGVSNNELLFEFSAALSDIDPIRYFWELLNLNTLVTWFNGYLNMHNGRFDSFNTTELIGTINVDGNVIEATIALSAETTDIDGGSASSVYLPDQIIDGGTA